MLSAVLRRLALSSLEKILIPIDFSERCLGAARYAIPLAERFHSEVNLLHVLPPFGDSDDAVDGVSIGEIMTARRARAQMLMDHFLNAALHHLRVKRTLLDGDPAIRIVEWSLRERSDLIMMPTHGYGPFRRLLLGSVTAKVVHDADCPVWTGAHLEQGPPVEWSTLGRIACAVDLRLSSDRALEWAARLAGEVRAVLFLIHVVSRLASPGEEHYSHEFQQKVVESANTRIAQLQTRTGTNALVLLEAGEIPNAVCAAAAREHADLLVIGRGLMNASRFPTNAYAIIRTSTCPVVSV
ncbi:MAG: universal stress protein [Candidatus Sulfotelmatobacter sp.]